MSKIDLIRQSGLFDAEYYCKRYADVGDQDPLLHFVSIGSREGRKSSDGFDAGWYLVNYPDVAFSQIDPLVHYIEYGQAEGRQTGLSDRRIQLVRDLISQHAENVPDLKHDAQFRFLDRMPYCIGVPINRVSRLWTILFRSLERPYRRLLIIPNVVRDGANYIADFVLSESAGVAGFDDLLVVVADEQERPVQSWMPEGTSTIYLSDIEPSLTIDERARLIELLIFALKPNAVFNCGSVSCWQSFCDRAAALSRITRLFALSESDRSVSWKEVLRRTIPYLKRLYIGDDAYVNYVKHDVMPESSQTTALMVFRQSVPGGVERASTLPVLNTRRCRVLWSGHFSTRKNLELLVSIARLCPEMVFDIYGTGPPEIKESLLRAGEVLGNVNVSGACESVRRLPCSDFGAFLYTGSNGESAGVLLEAAACGLPIVGRAEGAVADIVTANTGWPIGGTDGAPSYVRALREIAATPNIAARKVERMLEYLRVDRNKQAMKEAFLIEPSFISAVEVARDEV